MPVAAWTTMVSWSREIRSMTQREATGSRDPRWACGARIRLRSVTAACSG
jgi:hypothetical protein